MSKSANGHVGGSLRQWATVPTAPYPAEGPGHFSNLELIALLLGVPFTLTYGLHWIKPSFFPLALLTLVGVAPLSILYWTIVSRLDIRLRNDVVLPGKPIEDYLTFKDPALAKEYHGKKINMQHFHDLYFADKVDFKGDPLKVMECRYDWANFHFTLDLFKFVFFQFLPEVIVHSQSQDEEQVRDHYDRGDDFYAWFLGPRMIYTSGIVSDPTREETLEELQDTKLALVCEKLGLRQGSKMLDIGCGWGTLSAFAAKNFGADVTGITLGKNQTKFGNERIAKAGLSSSQARIECKDYREITKGVKYDAISCLEMAEHVGVRHYQAFLRQVYDLLDDQGTVVWQVAGIRKNWRFEDLVWGLFMNKYIFPGADASCALCWVVDQIESAGFEIQSVETFGVSYGATIWRWYKNWLSNEAEIKAKYGDRWFRIWTYFLAYSTIIARQGTAGVHQLVLKKNLNSTDRLSNLSPGLKPSGKAYTKIE